MNKLLLVFLLLFCIITFYYILKLKTDLSELEDKYNKLVYNNSLSTEITLDKLKVKNLEIENNLTSPNIKTNNLSSINDKININNDIYVKNDVNVNPKAGIKVKLDLGNGFDKHFIGNKDKSFELKNINTNYKLSFDDMIMRDLTYLYHVENNKLHNGKSSDQFVMYQMNEKDNKKENKIENFTDLFYL